jgi:hypothetical protein
MEINVTMQAMDPLFGKVLYYAVQVREETANTVFTFLVAVSAEPIEE